MGIEFAKKQKIKEFQNLIANPRYNEVARRLVEKVYAHRIILSFYDIPRSKARTSDRGSDICIKQKPVSENTLELIFDLMHELGHCLDEIKLLKKDENNEKSRREREIRAWQIADREFDSHPELKEVISEYAAYKEMCLATYGVSQPA